ncbi:MAG: DUF3006 domain-containing protein [Candidatus Marsarchaeota archaeon]|nr:DUF3006 domain-containing protein [Candidatus Marsarchaeota archaeon]
MSRARCAIREGEGFVWAVVDRIGGETAVLLVGDDEVPVSFPKKYLPKGVREGSVLHLSLKVDPQAEEKHGERTRRY